MSRVSRVSRLSQYEEAGQVGQGNQMKINYRLYKSRIVPDCPYIDKKIPGPGMPNPGSLIRINRLMQMNQVRETMDIEDLIVKTTVLIHSRPPRLF